MSTYLDLKKAILNENEDVDMLTEFVDNNMDKFRQYFNAIYEHVVGSESARLYLASGKWETEQYQDKIMKYDGDRKLAHDLAIDACAKLNRLCDSYKIEHFCPEVKMSKDGSKCVNRGEIADFVGKFMYETYQRGRGKSDLEIDEVMKKYDIKYGDRTYLDAAFSVAKDAHRDPAEAYKKGEEINALETSKPHLWPVEKDPDAPIAYVVEYIKDNGDVGYARFADIEEAKVFYDNLPDTCSAELTAEWDMAEAIDAELAPDAIDDFEDVDIE